MIRIGLVDDEQGARFSLRCALERALEERGLAGRIYEFSSAEGVLAWLAKHAGEVDVLFLDIMMKGQDGLAAAKAIRQADDELALVFVTGYRDYVFDGYTVGALDYLLKPPDPQKLSEVVDKVKARLDKQEPSVYTIQNAEGLYRLPRQAILYFMSDRRQVIAVTKSQRYAFYAKLDEVAKQLEGAGFIRLHRRYLANIQAIDRIEEDSAYLGAERLPISRSHKQAVFSALARYVVTKG